MRGTTLNGLIQMLRRELKIAESPALGKNTREGHAYALRSAQDRLYNGYDWPFKKVRRDVQLAAGQRYYAPPADLDLEGIRSVWLLYSGLWTELKRGIGEVEYNILNSDTGQRVDPVLKWDIYDDADGGDMIEAWPLPATGIATMRFKGIKKVSPLVADADKADLDDLLLVLYAAIDFVGPKDLGKAQQKAQLHLLNVRRSLSNGDTFISGGGCDPRSEAVRPRRITITPATTGG